MFLHVLSMLAVFTLVSAFPVPAPALDKAERTCAVAKLKATGKKVNAKIKCEAKAIQEELADPDPECIAKAEEKFGLAFGKAELKGGCVSDGDAVAVEGAVDSFVGGEVLRQTTGTGSELPTCSTPMQSCGSCSAGGMCVPVDQGNICIDMSFTPVTPCPVGGCPAGATCIQVSGQSGCVVGCP